MKHLEKPHQTTLGGANPWIKPANRSKEILFEPFHHKTAYFFEGTMIFRPKAPIKLEYNNEDSWLINPPYEEDVQFKLRGFVIKSLRYVYNTHIDTHVTYIYIYTLTSWVSTTHWSVQFAIRPPDRLFRLGTPGGLTVSTWTRSERLLEVALKLPETTAKT